MKPPIVSVGVVLSQTAIAQTSDDFLKDVLADFAAGKELYNFYVEQPRFIFGPHI
ncbi:hypothetical protein NI389_17495 (plasmid) [Pseudoalteromonas xiamenensis]|uniref:hypothetical protein n=1 Tax=Pseudoalteromonas xiamenensis TaxID=882626 RepID=UPI0027E46C67|nr:hypothetical protein [Pseudoalteromonas xiamenensis]WMN61610.1 hypothetical protein NI389_17495 [Pseudoalteromonas xiamenensis]